MNVSNFKIKKMQIIFFEFQFLGYNIFVVLFSLVCLFDWSCAAGDSAYAHQFPIMCVTNGRHMRHFSYILFVFAAHKAAKRNSETHFELSINNKSKYPATFGTWDY